MLGRWNKRAAREGVVGVEITSEGVAFAHVVRDGDARPRVATCEFRPCDDPEKIAQTLAGAVRDHKLADTHTVCVLPPHQYRLHLLDAPDVQPEEFDAATRWMVKDLIEVPLEEAVIDWFMVPERRGGRRRIYVTTARENVVDKAVETCAGSGLQLRAIDLSELALRNVTTLLPEAEQGAALLQLRSRSGLLTICQQGDLYLARGLELGIDSIREARAAEPDTLMLENESDALDALLLEVQRSLDYYESQLGPQPIGTVVLAPQDQQVPGLQDHLEKNLSAGTRTLDLNTLLVCKQSLPEGLQARCLAAIGGALRAEESGS